MSPLEGVMEAVMDTDVVPLEGAMEVEMEPQAPPKLRGLNPNEPAYKLLLCPHGKPGNGWFCGEAGCSGRGLCEHKNRSKCAGSASQCNAPCATTVESTHGAT